MTTYPEGARRALGLRSSVIDLAVLSSIVFVAVALAMAIRMIVVPGAVVWVNPAVGLVLAAYLLAFHPRVVEESVYWGTSSVLSGMVAAVLASLWLISVADRAAANAGELQSVKLIELSVFLLGGIVFCRGLHRLVVYMKTGHKPVIDMLLVFLGAVAPAFLIAASRHWELGLVSFAGFPLGIGVYWLYLGARREAFARRLSPKAPLIVPLRSIDVTARTPQEPVAHVEPVDFLRFKFGVGPALLLRSPSIRSSPSLARAIRDHLFKGDLVSARRRLRQLTEQGEEAEVVDCLLLDLFQGKPESVAAAHAMSPKSNSVAVLTACALRTQGKHSAAAELLNNQIRDPHASLQGREYLHTALADTCFHFGRAGEAHSEIEKAIEIDPFCPLIRARRAFYRFVDVGKEVLDESLCDAFRAQKVYKTLVRSLGLYSLARDANRTLASVLNTLVFPIWSPTVVQATAFLLTAKLEVEPDDGKQKEWLRAARRMVAKVLSVDPSDPMVQLLTGRLLLGRARAARGPLARLFLWRAKATLQSAQEWCYGAPGGEEGRRVGLLMQIAGAQRWAASFGARR